MNKMDQSLLLLHPAVFTAAAERAGGVRLSFSTPLFSQEQRGEDGGDRRGRRKIKIGFAHTQTKRENEREFDKAALN